MDGYQEKKESNTVYSQRKKSIREILFHSRVKTIIIKRGFIPGSAPEEGVRAAKVELRDGQAEEGPSLPMGRTAAEGPGRRTI